MAHDPSLFSLPPMVALHLVLALGALVLGPVALRARKGSPLHRGAGYAWVLLMVGTAVSALFIRSNRMAWVADFYGPIHLLSLVTLVGVTAAIVAVIKRRVDLHRLVMWRVYLGACVGAGAFTLLPGRYLGDLVWHHGLGLV